MKEMGAIEKRYENALIIGKEEDRSFFLGLRKDDPNLSFSFFSVNEIIDMFAYRYDDASLSYLRYAYEFDEFTANETLLIVSLMDKSSYESRRLKALIPLRDDLLKEGLLKKNEVDAHLFKGKNVLYFGLKTALPISLRLGELSNMALSFDLPSEGRIAIDPDIEKYRKLISEEKRELGLYY